jgi:protein-S-isoprenylcysteine O-methyltransferase Ste14
MGPRTAIVGLWLAWIISWLLAAAWSSRTEQRAGLGVEVIHRIPVILGGALMFVPAHGYEGSLRLWHIGWNGAWICVVLIATGIAFAWWARLHLGKLWSGSITRKADHRIVDSGPYGIVRHPIYTGLFLSVLATAAAKGTVLAVAGCACIILGFTIKARMEERWLREQLGAADYDAYRARVPMLVPFGPKATKA